MSGRAELTLPEILEQPGPSWRDQLGKLPWDRFCTVSLFNWLAAAKARDIECVPATEIWRGPIKSLMQFDIEEGPHIHDLRALHDAIAAHRAPNVMFRWDCCAPYAVKGRLGSGEPQWHEDFGHLPIDDPRAFDLLYEYPRDEMIVWSRPWVVGKIVESYPVEFRVFVKDGEVTAASNYYPQRDLPQEYLVEAARAMSLTRALIRDIPNPV